MSGSTPKELIDNVVVAEIKVMLRYTDLTVQQIAYHLDISSESFLCRFFRRMTGFTPLEYRNKTMLYLPLLLPIYIPKAGGHTVISDMPSCIG